MVGCEVAHQHYDQVEELGLVMVLAVVEQVAGNVSKLQRDALRAQDVLDVVVPDQTVEQRAGLDTHIQGVLGELSRADRVPSAVVPALVQQHPVQHGHRPAQLRALQGRQEVRGVLAPLHGRGEAG